MDWVGIGVYVVGVDVLLVWFVCAIVDYGRGWSCSDINVVLSKRQEVNYLYVDYLKGIVGWFYTILKISSLGLFSFGTRLPSRHEPDGYLIY